MIQRGLSQAAQQVTHTIAPRAYLSQKGDGDFLELLAEFVFESSARSLAAIQTVGGTGAVRLALELLKKTNSESAVHVGIPTWSNHVGISERLGLRVTTYPYYAIEQQQITEQASQVANFRRGDILVMNGPCHNPSGTDLDLATRLDLVRQVNAASGCVLLDLAYYGLGSGLEQDLAEVRQVINAADTIAVAVSCSKAFGLYGERTGALYIKTESSNSIAVIQSNLELIARQITSSAPRFGSDTVKTILSDEELTSRWAAELEQRRVALKSSRQILADALPFWLDNQISNQKGIFSLLPLTDDQIKLLDTNHAIHLPYSGRINVTGLNVDTIPRFAAALKQVWL